MSSLGLGTHAYHFPYHTRYTSKFPLSGMKTKSPLRPHQ